MVLCFAVITQPYSKPSGWRLTELPSRNLRLSPLKPCSISMQLAVTQPIPPNEINNLLSEIFLRRLITMVCKFRQDQTPS